MRKKPPKKEQKVVMRQLKEMLKRVLKEKLVELKPSSVLKKPPKKLKLINATNSTKLRVKLSQIFKIFVNPSKDFYN